MTALSTLVGGFLAAVLWFDLIFDVQVLGQPDGPLSEPILQSITGYYARALDESRGIVTLAERDAAVLLVEGSRSRTLFRWPVRPDPNRPHPSVRLVRSSTPADPVSMILNPLRTETEGAAVPVNGLDLRFGAPSHDGSGHRGCADERARLSFVHRPQGVGIEGCTLRSRARRDLASRIEIDNLTTNHSNSASCECRARRNPQLPCEQCRVVSLRVDREDAERFGQQGVPGQNGHSFAVHDVGGWATAAQRVVIH